MKKVLIILTFLGFCNIYALCQSNKDSNKSKKDTSFYTEYSPANPVPGEFHPFIECDSGIWRSYYKNGRVESEGRMIKKRKYSVEDGVWKIYTEDGKLSSIEEYKKGKLVKVKYCNTDTVYFKKQKPH